MNIINTIGTVLLLSLTACGGAIKASETATDSSGSAVLEEQLQSCLVQEEALRSEIETLESELEWYDGNCRKHCLGKRICWLVCRL